MSELYRRVSESYTEHYQRANIRDVTAHVHWTDYARSLDLMFGDLLASLESGSQVLDLGCGTGIFLGWLARQRQVIPVGVDSSPAQVEVAQQNLVGLEIHCQDGLEYLRENPDTFGGIFCFDVLEHLPQLDLCLEWVEAARAALQPGGFLCCRVPNAAHLTASYSRYMDITHARIFTRTSLLQLLEAGGLQDCYTVPIRSARLRGRLRLAVEALVHRAVFRICGNALEDVFTGNVCAVGFRKDNHNCE